MDNTTQQDNMQAMTPEEAKASLGLATRLSDQHLSMQAQPQYDMSMPPEGQNEPTGEDLKSIVENAVKEAMSGLRNEIKGLLEEDGQKD